MSKQNKLNKLGTPSSSNQLRTRNTRSSRNAAQELTRRANIHISELITSAVVVQKKTDPEDVCLVDISEPSPAAIKGKKEGHIKPKFPERRPWLPK